MPNKQSRMNNYYTYAYLREDGTPYYIGKGKERRVYSKRRCEINLPKDKNRIIFLKQNLSEEEAFKHEMYMISVLGRKDLGTGILRNRTNGGDGVSGAVRSEETKRKIGDAHRGKVLTEETKRKIGETKKGRVPTEEHRRKLSEVQKGKVLTEETKRKMSEFQKGKVLTEEHKRKLSEANKGRVLTEETKRKISEARKNRKNK